MIKRWEIKKLGEVCDFVRGPFGGTLKKSCFKPKGIAVYEQQHAIYDQFEEIRYFIDEKKFSEMQRFEVAPGDLIMSCSGTMGKVAIVPDNVRKGIINQALLKLSPNKNLLARFLKLWMGSLSFQDQLAKHSLGAAIKNVASVKTLKEIDVPLPPVSEQKHIISVLDEAFVALGKAKENAEKNLQNAREIFESYLQSVFANPGDEWEEKMLWEVGETQTGTTPKTVDKENYGNYIPFITPADIDISGDGTIRCREEGLSEKGLENGRKMKTNSILMVCIGASIGKVGFVDRDVSCNQQVNSLTVKKGFCPKFFYYALSTKGFFEGVIKNSAQATLPIINKGKWEKLTVSYPSSEKEQQFIVAKLDTLSAETKKLEAIYQQKLADLDELKKSILQKAFNGELVGACS